MSQTEQMDLTGEGIAHPTKDHLSKVKPRPGTSQGDMKAEKPREWFCLDCGRRITEGPDGREFGHNRKESSDAGRCPRRDEYLGEGI